MHVAHYSDFDNSTKSWMLMITDWQHQLLSMGKVVGMTWAMLLGSWAELLSVSLSISALSLGHRTQFSTNMASLFKPQMEKSFVRGPGVYRAAGRRADLRSWPFPWAVPAMRDDGWNLRPTMAGGDTDRRPGDKQRGSSASVRKEMTKITMEYCCKSSFKCGWMGWSLHMAFWLLASNGHWTGNNEIIGKKKVLTWKGTELSILYFWAVDTVSNIIRETGGEMVNYSIDRVYTYDFLHRKTIQMSNGEADLGDRTIRWCCQNTGCLHDNKSPIQAQNPSTPILTIYPNG